MLGGIYLHSYVMFYALPNPLGPFGNRHVMSCHIDPTKKKRKQKLDDGSMLCRKNPIAMTATQRLRILESIVLSKSRKIHAASTATALLLRRSALGLL